MKSERAVHWFVRKVRLKVSENYWEREREMWACEVNTCVWQNDIKTFRRKFCDILHFCRLAIFIIIYLFNYHLLIIKHEFTKILIGINMNSNGRALVPQPQKTWKSISGACFFFFFSQNFWQDILQKNAPKVNSQVNSHNPAVETSKK